MILHCEKDGIRYVCMPFFGRFKCGKCLRGNLNPNIGMKCRVCGAKVRSWFNFDCRPEPESFRELRGAWPLRETV